MPLSYTPLLLLLATQPTPSPLPTPSPSPSPTPTPTPTPSPSPSPAPAPLTVEAPPPEPEPIIDEGEVIMVVDRAPAESASSVHFDEEDLRRRPRNQPSDVLRQAPGLVVSQHAGGGKADQYFLRGFDADHGTDVAVFLDGIPVNLVSHGHGQGYADTHWLIPDTIASLDVHKGPYAARYGDFYTAGAVELRTLDEVDKARIAITTGTELTGPNAAARAQYRLVGMASPDVPTGTALVAGELGAADGPFLVEQDFRHGSVLGKWKATLGAGELRLATTFYSARWNQSGQIPAAEVRAGRLNRFGAINPTEGGTSSRSSLALGYQVDADDGTQWRLQAYAVGYRMRLYSNFTFFARDLENGDQIEQTDSRLLYGLDTAYRRPLRLGPVTGIITAGFQVRADDAETGLFHTARRVRIADCFGVANPCIHTDNRIRNIAGYVEADVSPAPWLRVIGGARLDHFLWDIEDLDPETALAMDSKGGTAQRAIASPKLSAIAHVHDAVDVFVNGGLGFHSNDGRAAVASRGKGALARAIGAEAGVRVEPIAGLRGSVDAWYLHLSSEQVWSGEAGGTEASNPTRRTGVDVEASWDATPWLAVDGNVALARSTFVANRGNGGALALAPKVMGGGGVTVHRGGFLTSLRARGIGDRPANDDESLTADGYLVLDAVVSHRAGPVELTLTVNNLLDAEWREAQFAEESRVAPGAPLMEDVHFTPGLPLTALVTATYSH